MRNFIRIMEEQWGHCGGVGELVEHVTWLSFPTWLLSWLLRPVLLVHVRKSGSDAICFTSKSLPITVPRGSAFTVLNILLPYFKSFLVTQSVIIIPTLQLGRLMPKEVFILSRLLLFNESSLRTPCVTDRVPGTAGVILKEVERERVNVSPEV